jgi:hypothetical protein
MISFEGGRRRRRRGKRRRKGPPKQKDAPNAAAAAAVDDEEHQRALEEQWMSGMTGLDEAATAGSSGEPWSWSSDLGLLFLAARHD